MRRAGREGAEGKGTRQGRERRGCGRLVGCDKDASVTGTARCDTGGRVVEGREGLIGCIKRRRLACDGRTVTRGTGLNECVKYRDGQDDAALT